MLRNVAPCCAKCCATLRSGRLRGKEIRVQDITEKRDTAAHDGLRKGEKRKLQILLQMNITDNKSNQTTILTHFMPTLHTYKLHGKAHILSVLPIAN